MDNTQKCFIVDGFKYYKVDEKDAFIAYAQTFPSIGKKKAEKIYHLYGCNYKCFEDVDKMSAVTSKKYVNEIVSRAEKDNNDGTTKLAEKLAKFNIMDKTLILKIASKISDEQFEKDPYILQSLKGVKISFALLNSIILQMQNEKPELLLDPRRIETGIDKALKILLSRGHTYTSANLLIEESIKYLNNGVTVDKCLVDDMVIKKALNSLNKKHLIKAEKTSRGLRIYNAFYYDSENFISEQIYLRLNDAFKKTQQKKIDGLIRVFENSNHIKLADSQKLAVSTIINSPMAVITGSAGTGKTTVLKATISTLVGLGKNNIILAAPTGRASRRMTESTGWPAQTLHSLLKIGIGDEDTDDVDLFVSSEKVEADAIFIDEVSMCDISIMYRLFEKVSKNCRIYFIGDPNQLPSVGSGNFLDDIIQSECVPVVKLKVIFRQARDSRIVMNAEKILRGDSSFEYGDDFIFVDGETPVETAQKLTNIYVKELNNTKDLFEVQCITPLRVNGELSAYNLNKRIQIAVNKNYREVSQFFCNGYKFFPGDKIMCCKNTETVRNGDIGMVISAEKNKLEAIFDTGHEVFSVDEAKELGIVLAYAITVHKSQGSEFTTILMPISHENRIMLKRNLFYTAVTRAKKRIYLLGEKSEIVSAVENNAVQKRKTLLKLKIQKRFK